MKSFREYLNEGRNETDTAIKKFIAVLEKINEFEDMKKLEPSLINIIKAIKATDSNYENTAELLSKLYKNRISIIANKKIKNIIS